MKRNAGREFRQRLTNGGILPLIGIYDVFSAKLAATRFEGLFCSGFSYAASAYGLPDIGYMTWRDISDFALRVRQAVPDAHLLVDVDDGFGDETIAATVVGILEANGASAVMLEDQKRPRRCGHYDGKEILPVEEYVTKLSAVLAKRESLFVIARTDASDRHEAMERALRYAEIGADGIMVEAIRDLALIRDLSHNVGCPIMVNQLHGGKSPDWTWDELKNAGVAIVSYSTPCLFSAQYGMERYLDRLCADQRLPDEGTVELSECTEILFGGCKEEAQPQAAYGRG